MFINIREPQERLRAIAESATNDGLRCFSATDTVIRFVRSAEQMVNTAKWKENNGGEEEAYYLFIKFSTLYLNKVMKHASFKTLDPAEQKRINRLIVISLDEGERLKPNLLRKFENEETIRRSNEEAAERSRADQEMAELEKKQRIEKKHQQHHDDAVLAQQLQQEERYAFHKDRAEALHRHLEQQQHHLPPTPPPAANQMPTQMSAQAPPPAANCAVLHHAANTTQTQIPASVAAAPPIVDRSAKPLVRHHSAGFTFRKITLPGDLASTFLRLALNNTSRDTETCGVLGAPASENASNELHVSHVLLPPQRGTPDSCTTENEEQLFQMVDQLNLLVVGWIHTHPSQTAFLSSVDLHTHAGYQHLFPESIAVVCSVKYNDNKVFRLTAPGLVVVSACNQTGFHTHPGTTTGEPLFEECSQEEVRWDNNGAHVQVVDLRN